MTNCVELQLLSHSGGLKVSGFWGYRQNQKLPTLLQILRGDPPANNEAIDLEYIPSTKYQYSGGGYQVVQLVLEEVYNKSYDQIAKEVLLDPLEMNNSSFLIPLQLDNTASGHLSNGKVAKGKWKNYPELAAAGLWTSAVDLSKFIIDIQKTHRNLSEVVITKDLTSQMLTSKIDIPDTKKTMGLGFVLTDDGRNEYFEHSGDTHGYKAYFMAYHQLPFGIIILTNSANGHEIFQGVVDAILEVY